MLENVTGANLEEYEAFISAHPKGHFAQSSLWAKQKPQWKWAAIMSRGGDGKIRGSVSVLIRKAPGLPYSLMYSCRGPVCDLHDRETLTELASGLQELSRKYRLYLLKIDTDTPSSDSEFKEIMDSLGFKLHEAGKNFEGIQPRYVFRLNVEGKTADELMSSFHSKTRYNIRLAERKGVVVKLQGKEALDDFSRLMLETGVRDGFTTRKKEYFEAMMDNLGPHVRLYMAYHEDIAIAGTLAIWFGDKVWYLYGASSNEYRNLMPNYLLQWSMIQWAVEKKCRLYDFRGVSGDLSEDNPLYGLYKFKKGFNGDFVEFVGEYEYVYKPLVNSLITRGTSVFMKLRKSLYILKNKGKV